MSGKTGKTSKVANQSQALVQKQNIPVQMTDFSIFDDTFVSMKERFSEEMKRLDQHMFALSKALTTFYNQNLTVQGGLPNTSDDLIGWDDITNSPLVEGDEDNKTLKLQFDVSHFRPEEIEVKIADNILTVSAIHEEKSDTCSEHREYHRYFALPNETDPASVVSSLSRDGVLIVHAPLIQPAIKEVKQTRK